MRIEVVTSTAQDASRAAADLRQQLAVLSDRRPSFIALHASHLYDLEQLRDGLGFTAQTALHGATSCKGVMSHQHHTLDADQSAGLFALWDEDGDYGTAARPLGDDPCGNSQMAAETALERADRVGETPDLVWLSVTPGQEEDVLRGVRAVVGDDVPIVGGSAADNDVAGDWAIWDAEHLLQDGVVVSMLFLSGYQADAFQSGYSPSQRSGRVTRAEGRRIFEIDDQPAAKIYERWTSGTVPAATDGDESRGILAQSTLWPLARQVLRRDGQSDYLLVHPAAVNTDGSIDVFAEVEEGETLTQMTGTSEALVDRAGQVAELSLSTLQKGRSEARGALVVYCGGCMMAVQDDIGQVTDNIRDNLPDIPFLGIFTFGEQGHVPSGGNWHGNLMISCVTFGV